jgi:hypothetical protein
MGKTLQGPVDLGSGHQLALLDDSHIRVMLTQVREWKSGGHQDEQENCIHRANKGA